MDRLTDVSLEPCVYHNCDLSSPLVIYYIAQVVSSDGGGAESVVIDTEGIGQEQYVIQYVTADMADQSQVHAFTTGNSSILYGKS